MPLTVPWSACAREKSLGTGRAHQPTKTACRSAAGDRRGWPPPARLSLRRFRLRGPSECSRMTPGLVIALTLIIGLPISAAFAWKLRFGTCALIAACIVMACNLIAHLADDPGPMSLGTEFEQYIERTFPSNPRLDDSFLWSKLPTFLGHLTGLILSSVAMGFVYWAPSALVRRLRRVPFAMPVEADQESQPRFEPRPEPSPIPITQRTAEESETVHFLCKSCFAPLEADSALAWSPFECPTCHTVNTVPIEKRR